MTRVILDFADAADPHATPARHSLGPPLSTIVADAAEQVPAALREVEAAAARGAWAVGFVAYEAASAFDPALHTRPHDGPAPLLWFGVFDEFDLAPPPPRTPTTPRHWTTSTPRSVYDADVGEIRQRIAAGDVYQVNHTLRFSARCDDALALYDALVAPRHGRYHALIETDEWAVISASPELFFDMRGRNIVTRPMKGTLRRGRWSAEDRAAAKRLAGSAKDRAENLMIVDLLRNDLGRIARFGSVRVPRLFDIETYPTVHQMTSTITAELRPDVRLYDVFAAMFPCGSVTGAPKVTAMRTITRLEDATRGPYCGAVGIVRPDGSATFNVAIRTALLDRRTDLAVYGAGGGITWDSRADAEYDEVIAKAAILTDSLPPFDLLETMRCDDGVIQRLDYHMRRLDESAQYWGFPRSTAAAARTTLEGLACALPPGSRRLRLAAAPDGNVSVTHSPLPTPAAGPCPSAHETASLDSRRLDRDGLDRGALDRDGLDRDGLDRDGLGGRRDRFERVRAVAIARRAITRNDRLLFHKTTARHVYDARRAEVTEVVEAAGVAGAGVAGVADIPDDIFDVLLFNGEGEVTEFTLGNVVAEIDGVLLTPCRAAGLLAGTLRQQLLDQGVVREAVITLEQVRSASRLWHINSVRGCTPVTLHTAAGGMAARS